MKIKYLQEHAAAKRVLKLNVITENLRALKLLLKNGNEWQSQIESCILKDSEHLEKHLKNFRKWWRSSFLSHKTMCEKIEENKLLIKKVNIYNKNKLDELMGEYKEIRQEIKKIENELKLYYYLPISELVNL